MIKLSCVDWWKVVAIARIFVCVIILFLFGGGDWCTENVLCGPMKGFHHKNLCLSHPLQRGCNIALRRKGGTGAWWLGGRVEGYMFRIVVLIVSCVKWYRVVVTERFLVCIHDRIFVLKWYCVDKEKVFVAVKICFHQRWKWGWWEGVGVAEWVGKLLLSLQ